jgi:hypothetical protein
MPAPACVSCGLFFKRRRNGVTIEERMPRGAVWLPYKLWHADLWECEGCGTQIVTGYGNLPLVEHYQPTYAEIVEQLPPIARIDDCGGGPFNAERASARRASR